MAVVAANLVEVTIYDSGLYEGRIIIQINKNEVILDRKTILRQKVYESLYMVRSG